MKTRNLLREISLFKNISAEVLNKIADIAIELTFPKGKIILQKGEPVKGFYILTEGKVKIFTIEPISGKEQIVKITEPVALFGEAASLSGSPMPVSVQTLEKSRILFIDRERLLKLMEKYPEICLKISKVLSQRLYHLVNLVEILTLNSAISRLARYILSTADGSIVQDFKTSLIAMHLGLTPEAVSRAISQLKREGIIEKTGKRIRILKPQELKILAGLF